MTNNVITLNRKGNSCANTLSAWLTWPACSRGKPTHTHLCLIDHGNKHKCIKIYKQLTWSHFILLYVANQVLIVQIAANDTIQQIFLQTRSVLIMWWQHVRGPSYP